MCIIFLQVADLIASEFFEQGDLEKTQLNIKPAVRNFRYNFIRLIKFF